MRQHPWRTTLVALAAVVVLAAMLLLFGSRAVLAPAGAPPPMVAATVVPLAIASATTAPSAVPGTPSVSEPTATPASGTADPSPTRGFRSFPYIAPTSPPPPAAAPPRPAPTSAPAPAPPRPAPAAGPTPTARELFAACKAAVDAEAWDTALQACDGVRRLDAKYPGLDDALAAAYVGLGEARLQERKWSEARDLCQRALEITPDLAAAKACQAAAGGGITEVD
jgi:hypothetical protein